ncbi:hypothetical protein Mal52_55090 [Symmachiella dynata]|uniref:MraY-like glycosyltransferase n=1 Tax=Symmachiella dynata TaxID=2527995 RepID=A0A517ZWX6_9PLAN|nr:hypothetical protein [Symmachiella dynata]QDU46981.1 hypothetical protein Mal52_55090 [Symmachiella dynata]
MPRPQFTKQEQVLIDWVKVSSGDSSSYMWTYLVTTAIIAGFAVYFESIVMLVCAFVIVGFFRIKEEHAQKRWAPIWTSILTKYEEALADGDVSPEQEGET